MWRGELTEAIEEGGKAVELHPYLQISRANYAMALECAGRLDEALEQYQLGSVMSLILPWMRALEATCLAKMGRLEDARRMLGNLEQLRRTEYVDAYYMAVLRDALGQRTEAFTELERAYHETVSALASALESKDLGTGEHSQRVHRYAAELARVVAPSLVDDESVAYGFVLHDIGKIGIPDSILQKPGPLTQPERRVMQTHTVLGEQMLAGVTLLQRGGLEVVRSHHERWDGQGYPDGLAGDQIPMAARVFAVADALDAMTSDRPYRLALSWTDARHEIAAKIGSQFDPDVVEAFTAREHVLREIREELAAA